MASLGRRIVSGDLKEQFLSDGGHFELSPMYHSIVLEDLLDLINLCQASRISFDAALLPILREAARKSLAWLQAIVDEKGNIPLLNDSAHGIAPGFDELRSYARRLGVSPNEDREDELKIGPWTGRNLSGYLVLKNGPFRLIFDTAILGPDHLPGHAHCDMLSVLLDFEEEAYGRIRVSLNMKKGNAAYIPGGPPRTIPLFWTDWNRPKSGRVSEWVAAVIQRDSPWETIRLSAHTQVLRSGKRDWPFEVN